MSPYTPGPWTALGGGRTIGVYTTSRDDEPISQPVHVASCWLSLEVDGHANARLIAAAPDLLAALKRVWVLPRPWIDGATSWERWEAACQAIDDAIKKAEGSR